MFALLVALLVPSQVPDETFGRPHGYVCLRTEAPRELTIGASEFPGTTIMIDGRLDEPAWKAAPWTSDFVDIEGAKKPKPRLSTRAKMLWDDHYFYFAAELNEPHVWATLTQHDSVIFHDNDFEIFLDPDGDNHNYGEFEMNALNGTWDLRLPKPYKDGGRADDAFEITGLKSAVHVLGTINDPSDLDRGWTLEVAMPWRSLRKLDTYATRPRSARRTGSLLNDYVDMEGWKALSDKNWVYAPDPPRPVKRQASPTSIPPRAGEQWRVNFSRVEWLHEVVDAKYVKVPNRREDNWVWSPQGFVNMHRPETWGVVQFSSLVAGTQDPHEVEFRIDPAGPLKHLLHRLYYAQRNFQQINKRTGTIPELNLNAMHEWLVQPIRIVNSGEQFQISGTIRVPDGSEQTWHIRHDALLWRAE